MISKTNFLQSAYEVIDLARTLQKILKLVYCEYEIR